MVAQFNCIQVVVLSKPKEEAGGKLIWGTNWHTNDFRSVGFDRGDGNRANSQGQEVSSRDTSLVELTGSPFSLSGGDVGLDSLSVEGVVLSHGSSELCGIGKDSSPGFNGLDIGSHALAGLQCNW